MPLSSYVSEFTLTTDQWPTGFQEGHYGDSYQENFLIITSTRRASAAIISGRWDNPHIDDWNWDCDFVYTVWSCERNVESPGHKRWLRYEPNVALQDTGDYVRIQYQREFKGAVESYDDYFAWAIKRRSSYTYITWFIYIKKRKVLVKPPPTYNVDVQYWCAGKRADIPCVATRRFNRRRFGLSDSTKKVLDDLFVADEDESDESCQLPEGSKKRRVQALEEGRRTMDDASIHTTRIPQTGSKRSVDEDEGGDDDDIPSSQSNKIPGGMERRQRAVRQMVN